ncbi:hypothetical protein IPM62_04790 [Candidatus Woesebacteria bacterium]|nr:MAG: hypothetical protein IPM62_04790 [Candidatus Woesebacteria bacterium]
MGKRLVRLAPIFLMTFLPTLFVWLPYLLRLESIWKIPLTSNGMATVVANYDGPLYIVIAKTFYNLDMISKSFSFDLPLEYYAAHFPMYPILIFLVASVTNLFSAFSSFAGYPYAMLISTLISSFLAMYFFNKFIKQYTSEPNALWITFVFGLLPARWLIVRSVGSPEPLFVAAIIASIYYFQNKKYWLAAVWGVVAQLTKSPGVLLFLAYGLTITAQSFKQIAISKAKAFDHILNWRAYPVVLIPLSLLGLFSLYSIRFNNFFAYFNSGDNIHLFFPPFQVFNSSAPWVGTFWLEDIIFIYLLGTIGIVQLIDIFMHADKKDRERHAVVMWFAIIYFVSILFVSHRDVARYSLPIVPFLFAAWHKFFTTKEFKIAFFIIIIPIFLYSYTFITGNTIPISDWAPLL